MDFLQRLTSAVNRMIPNSEARQIIIESLTFENANFLCKRIIGPLKARSTPLDEWIQDTTNIKSHNHDIEDQPALRILLYLFVKRNLENGEW